jgi:hypothetical protein
MSPADVLAQAHAAGVELLIYGGKLASRGPAPAELRAAIRAHKPELVALLTGSWPAWSAPKLPDDDEHARWLRGEISFAAAFCRRCQKALGPHAVVHIGHGVLLHKACGHWVQRTTTTTPPSAASPRG